MKRGFVFLVETLGKTEVVPIVTDDGHYPTKEEQEENGIQYGSYCIYQTDLCGGL